MYKNLGINIAIVVVASMLTLGSADDVYDEEPDSGSSLGDSSDPGTDSGSCDHESDRYKPYNDVQVDSFCQTARVYQCGGDDASREGTCEVLDDFLQSAGGGSVGQCPAC